MIPLIASEVEWIVKNVKDNKLVCTSKGKKGIRARTYYCLGDDFPTLKELASMRGYKSIKQLMNDQ